MKVRLLPNIVLSVALFWCWWDICVHLWFVSMSVRVCFCVWLSLCVVSLSRVSVSVVFPWYTQHRQIKIFGHAAPTDAEVSDAYFDSRPRGSQVSAWASDQSHPISSREALEEKVHEIESRFHGEERLPRPEKWGGFVIEPQRIEFWAGRTSRLHDRIRFEKTSEGWVSCRLQP